HAANRPFERMLSTQFAGRSHGISPIELDMWPVAHTHLLFERTNHGARFPLVDQTGVLSLAKRIENFNALPRRPQHAGVGFAIEKRNRRSVMYVSPALVSQPPRGVGVDVHFLSERRNAAPSNVARRFPTARFSANCRVMRG